MNYACFHRIISLTIHKQQLQQLWPMKFEHIWGRWIGHKGNYYILLQILLLLSYPQFPIDFWKPCSSLRLSWAKYWVERCAWSRTLADTRPARSFRSFICLVWLDFEASHTFPRKTSLKDANGTSNDQLPLAPHAELLYITLSRPILVVSEQFYSCVFRSVDDLPSPHANERRKKGTLRTSEYLNSVFSLIDGKNEQTSFSTREALQCFIEIYDGPTSSRLQQYGCDYHQGESRVNINVSGTS